MTELASNTTTAESASTVADPWAAVGQASSAVNASAADPSANAGAMPAVQAAPQTYLDPWTGSMDPVASGAGAIDAPTQVAHAASNAVAAAPDAHSAGGFALHQLWDGTLPVEQWINQGLDWVVTHFRPLFLSVRVPVDHALGGIEDALTALPAPAVIAIVALLAWQFAGRGVAIGIGIALSVIAMLGIWPEAMTTLSLVLTSLVFCMVIGLPLGVLLARSDRLQRFMRPLLDAMQTTPAFVYLVPVVMLFGIGNVPGVIVTVIFALAPLVRLTDLGLRQVRPDLVEAARSYGASPMQLLLKVQLPLAMPSIMAGINQALMMSLSMVVIASMIAVGGLGQMVLRGIGRLDMGLATVGGLGIVLLAISLDRLTQAMGRPQRAAGQRWRSGPVGLLLGLAKPRSAASAASAPPASPGIAAAASGGGLAATASH
ncbi:glycine betaine/L-proline ABC transporter permease ProW [Variovorax dokdonensis]|uniref:Glycine betaine/L-proline ABC transporter permease ProW n=1 Tax=Variovorax dokdonensis TaxID=344883 RepID=A0ABT7N8F1_9BURK|nr:glycine betaine/L-proline ABC transporter permease ProW [Variovorax dokdonensis]MDM0044218.1 glycine betaine/L-proline ABC transporter permease ProW [Variovorax dokdonensis]